jgi:hypothetical protein
MKIEITRELKIKLLQAFKEGYIDTNNFPELNADAAKYDFDYSNLTDEEREVLLRVGEKVLDCKFDKKVLTI